MAVATDRQNDRNAFYLELFRQARQIVEEKKQWPSGSSMTVMEGTYAGSQAKFYLKCREGRVDLYFYKRGADGDMSRNFYSKAFPMAMLNPLQGWARLDTATETNFLAWRRRTHRALLTTLTEAEINSK